MRHRNACDHFKPFTVNATAARIRADTAFRVSYLDNPVLTGNRQLVSRDRHSVAILVSSSLKEVDIEGQIDHLRTIVRTAHFTSYVTGSPAQNYDNTVVRLILVPSIMAIVGDLNWWVPSFLRGFASRGNSFAEDDTPLERIEEPAAV